MGIYIANSLIPYFALLTSKRNHLKLSEADHNRDKVILGFMLLWYTLTVTFENVWGTTGRDYESYRYHTYLAESIPWGQVFNLFITHPITKEAGALLIEKIAGSIIKNYNIYRLCLVSFILYANFSFFVINYGYVPKRIEHIVEYRCVFGGDCCCIWIILWI